MLADLFRDCKVNASNRNMTALCNFNVLPPSDFIRVRVVYDDRLARVQCFCRLSKASHFSVQSVLINVDKFIQVLQECFEVVSFPCYYTLEELNER